MCAGRRLGPVRQPGAVRGEGVEGELSRERGGVDPLLGSEHGAIHAARQRPGVGRIDSPLANGVRLRIVTLPEGVDPFPAPGGADGPARAASEKNPSFFDGPGAAWELFESRESKPPFTQQGKR